MKNCKEEILLKQLPIAAAATGTGALVSCADDKENKDLVDDLKQIIEIAATTANTRILAAF